MLACPHAQAVVDTVRRAAGGVVEVPAGVMVSQDHLRTLRIGWYLKWAWDELVPVVFPPSVFWTYDTSVDSALVKLPAGELIHADEVRDVERCLSRDAAWDRQTTVFICACSDVPLRVLAAMARGVERRTAACIVLSTDRVLETRLNNASVEFFSRSDIDDDDDDDYDDDDIDDDVDKDDDKNGEEQDEVDNDLEVEEDDDDDDGTGSDSAHTHDEDRGETSASVDGASNDSVAARVKALRRMRLLHRVPEVHAGALDLETVQAFNKSNVRDQLDVKGSPRPVQFRSLPDKRTANLACAMLVGQWQPSTFHAFAFDVLPVCGVDDKYVDVMQAALRRMARPAATRMSACSAWRSVWCNSAVTAPPPGRIVAVLCQVLVSEFPDGRLRMQRFAKHVFPFAQGSRRPEGSKTTPRILDGDIVDVHVRVHD